MSWQSFSRRLMPAKSSSALVSTGSGVGSGVGLGVGSGVGWALSAGSGLGIVTSGAEPQPVRDSASAADTMKSRLFLILFILCLTLLAVGGRIVWL